MATHDFAKHCRLHAGIFNYLHVVLSHTDGELSPYPAQFYEMYATCQTLSGGHQKAHCACHPHADDDYWTFTDMPLFHDACHVAFRLYVCCACPHCMLAVWAGHTIAENHVSAYLSHHCFFDLQRSPIRIQGTACKSC